MRGAKYRAGKKLRGGDKENNLLYGEKRFAREELEKQKHDPARVAQF